MVTAAPAFASSWAKWAPRPLDAPVTKAVFPVRSSRSRILTPSAAVFRLWIKIVEQSRGAALGGDVEMQEYGPSGEPAGSARPVFLGILRDLETGRMVPGQRLVETELASRHGGGRNAGREAMQHLDERKSGVVGKGVSVRVEFGGGR